MTKIKCRYKKACCCHYNPGYRKNRDDIDEYWFCDSDDLCEGYKPRSGDISINPICKEAYWDYREFEKNVASYSFEMQNGLTIRGKFIDTDVIEYLEIDGRIIIDEQGEVKP